MNTTSPIQLRSLRFLADCKPNQVPREFEFTFSLHGNTRCSQRGLSDDQVAMALKYGTVFYKQGLQYYVLGEKDIPEKLAGDNDRYRNIVVVVAGDSDIIITCYRSRNPYKHLKLKTKIFVREAA